MKINKSFGLMANSLKSNVPFRISSEYALKIVFSPLIKIYAYLRETRFNLINSKAAVKLEIDS